MLGKDITIINSAEYLQTLPNDVTDTIETVVFTGRCSACRVSYERIVLDSLSTIRLSRSIEGALCTYYCTAECGDDVIACRFHPYQSDTDALKLLPRT